MSGVKPSVPGSNLPPAPAVQQVQHTETGSQAAVVGRLPPGCNLPPGGSESWADNKTSFQTEDHHQTDKQVVGPVGRGKGREYRGEGGERKKILFSILSTVYCTQHSMGNVASIL